MWMCGSGNTNLKIAKMYFSFPFLSLNNLQQPCAIGYRTQFDECYQNTDGKNIPDFKTEN